MAEPFPARTGSWAGWEVAGKGNISSQERVLPSVQPGGCCLLGNVSLSCKWLQAPSVQAMAHVLTAVHRAALPAYLDPPASKSVYTQRTSSARSTPASPQ